MKKEILLNKKKIEKPSIILTSAGRTGTKFFSILFKACVNNIDSFHMPDKLPQFSDISAWKEQTGFFGFYNVTAGRVIGKFGLRFLSDLALTKRKEPQYIVESLFRHRNSLVNKLPNKYYSECNPAFYGLLPYVDRVWERAKTIYIVRNGYDWVRSHMNWGHWYNGRKIISPFTRRLGPHHFQDDSCKQEWHGFDRFQKLCWAWNRINSMALEDLQMLDNARLYKFEKIFEKDENHFILNDLVKFATSHLAQEDVSLDIAVNMVNEKVNLNTKTDFPKKEFWTNDMHRFFNKICGDLMSRLGYSLYT